MLSSTTKISRNPKTARCGEPKSTIFYKHGICLDTGFCLDGFRLDVFGFVWILYDSFGYCTIRLDIDDSLRYCRISFGYSLDSVWILIGLVGRGVAGFELVAGMMR